MRRTRVFIPMPSAATAHCPSCVSDLVVAAPSDEPPPLPPFIDLLILRVSARADADPLPRAVIHKVVEAPQARRELLHGLAPYVCVREDGPGQCGRGVRVWDRRRDGLILMGPRGMRGEGAVRGDGVHGHEIACILLYSRCKLGLSRWGKGADVHRPRRRLGAGRPTR